ncbi:MAG TPA: GNAT family N-acetyltransferase [Acidobacteriota bacterium]|nr:GNAT family N-acetyltransferase [Acidobacteriota bacterium]
MEIIEAVRQDAAARTRQIEIRGPLPPAAGFAEVSYYKYHVLDLYSDPNEVLKKVDKRTILYNIRKAQKAGVEIIEDNTLSGCEAFYRLNLLTRKKHGIPSQPQGFFSALLRNLVEPGRAFVLLAIYESRVVAGGIFFKLGDTVYFKYGASDPRVLDKFSPNHLLAWTAIRKACLEGFRTFNFGRTAPDNQGLMRYKKMWGGEIKDLPYSYFPGSPGVLKKREHGMLMKTLKSVWRLVPEPLASKIAPQIVKHFG